MKKLISLMLILGTTLTSYANTDANKDARKKERFAQVKSMAQSNIDKRISALQETKSCISSANDKDSLKSCRQEAKKRHQAIKQEMKQMREQFRHNRGARNQQHKLKIIQ